MKSFFSTQPTKTNVWIETAVTGERFVVTQHDGHEPFDYAVFGVNIKYSSPSISLAAATDLALQLGAQSPVLEKARMQPDALVQQRQRTSLDQSEGARTTQVTSAGTALQPVLALHERARERQTALPEYETRCLQDNPLIFEARVMVFEMSPPGTFRGWASSMPEARQLAAAQALQTLQ